MKLKGLLECLCKYDWSIKLDYDLAVPLEVGLYYSVYQYPFFWSLCRIVVCNECQNETVGFL